MKKTAFTRIGMGLIALSMLGCQADVDMKNIDMSASVAADISLPLGTLKTSLGNFFGDSTLQGLYVDDNHQFYFQTTTSDIKEFHGVDFSSVSCSSLTSFNLYDEIKKVYPLIEFSPIIPADISLPLLSFDLPVSFEGLNDNPNNERVDSAVLTSAVFSCILNPVDFDLQWDELDSVSITLSDAFHTTQKEIIIPLENAAFGEPIRIPIKDFTFCLMKDPTKEPGKDNILSETNFTMHLKITTKKQHSVSSTTAVGFGSQIDELKFSAIYGYFAPSSQMRDKTDTLLTDYWPDFASLRGFLLPVRKPEIKLHVTHTMAMPLDIHLRELTFTQLNPLAVRSATFLQPSGVTTKDQHYYAKNVIPMDAPAGATNTAEIIMDYTPEHGHIDSIFSIKMDRVRYDFSVNADTSFQTGQKQFRITDNTYVKLDVDVKVPFDFNPGMSFTLSDTIDNINITELDIDSLLREAQIIPDADQTNLTMTILVENTIPFDVTFQMTFLDKNNQIIPILSDSQTIPAPSDIVEGVAATPSQKKIELSLSYNDLKELPKTKKIILKLALGNNTVPAKLLTTNGLSFKIGLSAHVKAQVNVQNL